MPSEPPMSGQPSQQELAAERTVLASGTHDDGVVENSLAMISFWLHAASVLPTAGAKGEPKPATLIGPHTYGLSMMLMGLAHARHGIRSAHSGAPYDASRWADTSPSPLALVFACMPPARSLRADRHHRRDGQDPSTECRAP